MDKEQLQIFYDNEPQREAVRAFMLQQLDKLALQDIYRHVDVSGYAEARKTVDKLFTTLEAAFGKKQTPSKVNQAK